MDLELSPDQTDLRDELRRFLDAEVTSERRRAAADLPGAVDRDLWAALSELGAFTVAVPESDGGVGLGWAEATIVFEELGQAATPGPLVGTAVARAHGIDDDVVGLVSRAAPALVEHAGGLDALLVVDGRSAAVVHGAADALRGETVKRPLDPLTPVTIVTELPAGEAAGDAAAIVGQAALLAAAQQVGLADAAVALAVACIQVHGGIGYTWELDAHLLLKRVLVLDQTPMTPVEAQEAIATNL